MPNRFEHVQVQLQEPDRDLPVHLPRRVPEGRAGGRVQGRGRVPGEPEGVRGGPVHQHPGRIPGTDTNQFSETSCGEAKL